MLFFSSCKSSSIKETASADNSFCLDCHLNYKDEPLAKNHLSAEIGCTKCHGDSFAHAGDENATIAPDKIYSRMKINKSCMECHDQDSIDKNCTQGISTKAKNRKVCTDCHGKHRLIERERKWDKETGKLIWPDIEEGL